MKKTMATVMVLAGLLVISFSACSSGGDSPTGPSPIPNSFQIVSIQNYGDSVGNARYGVTISYTNNTNSDATLTGTFYFGDGASQEVKEITSAPGGWPIPQKTTRSEEVGRFNHRYGATRTYHVKAEFTANFKNENIQRTFEKDFQIGVQELSSETMMR